DAAMTRSGIGCAEQLDPQRVELPHLHRIPSEGVDRRVLHRVVLRPDPTRRAEVGNSALGRDAGPRQDDAGLALADEGRQVANGVGHRRRVTRVDGFRFSTDVTVRFAETDAQGVAHNANYLIWFEVARVAYLAEYAGGCWGVCQRGAEWV